MIVRNANGREFTVRVIRKGERYGYENRAIHTHAIPLIIFYDRKHMAKPEFSEFGQQVSAYRADTIASHVPGVGLDLHMGVDAWKVDGEALRPVITLARELINCND